MYYYSITDRTKYVMVRPGESAEFYCVVDSNPSGADHVEWKREGFDLAARSTSTYSEGSRSLYLVVRNVTADDSGEFECVANNGIGEEVRNKSFLLVRSEYSIACDIKE